MEIPTIAILIGTVTAVGGLCYKIGSKNNNKNPNSNIYKKLDEKVDIPNCHRAQDELKGHFDMRIDDTRRHLSDKLDMAIELIRKNGGDR